MNYWRTLGLSWFAAIAAVACGEEARTRGPRAATAGDAPLESGGVGQGGTGLDAEAAAGQGSDPQTAGAPSGGASPAGAGPSLAGADNELGGAGGDGPTVAPPLIDEQPRDRTVVEGRDATFRVVARDEPLRYTWERSNDQGQSWLAAGSSVSAHTVAATLLDAVGQGGDDNARFRVVVANDAGSVTSASARLHVLAIGAAARIYAQHTGAPALWENDIASASGAGYSTTADLAAGTFAAQSGDGESQQHAYAGLHTIRFINHYPTAITIAAGDIKLVYSGTYSHSPDAQIATAQSTGILSAVVSPASSFDTYARLVHQTQRAGFSNPQITEQQGGVVEIHAESSTSLSAELRLPELTIPPGQSLSLSCSLLTSSVSGVSSFSTPAHLSMKLPPGVSLDSTSIVPLDWVTN